MIRTAVVDDRQTDVERLQTLLRVYASENQLSVEVSVFASGEQFLEQLKSGQFDLVFMDIVMDGMDGMETARRMRVIDPKTLLVFVTTESDYAIDGYEVEATAFLIKAPQLDRKQFNRVMHRLDAKLRGCMIIDLSDTAIRLKLPSSSLYYAEITDHKLTIHTSNGSYKLRMTLEQLKTRLPQDNGFFECYKGIIINLDAVDSINRQNVVMKDGTILPVSRRKYGELSEAYAMRSFTKLRK